MNLSWVALPVVIAEVRACILARMGLPAKIMGQEYETLVEVKNPVVQHACPHAGSGRNTAQRIEGCFARWLVSVAGIHATRGQCWPEIYHHHGGEQMRGLLEALKGWSVYLVVVVAIAGLGYWAGDHNRNNAWLAKQGQIEREAHKQYQAEVKRGETASGAYLKAYQNMQNQFESLTEKFHAVRKRSPLVVSAPGAACAGAVAGSGPSAAGADTGFANDVPVLTAGAVWMWNSALTGRDQPAGACSALDGSPAACAVATPLTLDDAWDNHATNAQLCAEDRLAHQRLIDFLTQGKAK